MPIQRAKPRFTEVKNVSIGASQIAANAVGATQLDLTDDYAFSGTISGIPTGTEIEVDQWELPSHFDDGFTSVVVITTWQRNTSATYAKIGNGMTHSSGVFSFPRTGVWTIKLDTMYYARSGTSVFDDQSMGIVMYGSTNNFSSESSIGTANTSMHYIGSGNQYVNASVNVIFNCTDISTHKVRFKTSSIATSTSPSSIQVVGVAANIHTGVIFERIGDAQ